MAIGRIAIAWDSLCWRWRWPPVESREPSKTGTPHVPSRRDKNAGNSGDLVKHTVYLAMLGELVRG